MKTLIPILVASLFIGGCWFFNQKPVCPDKTLNCTNDAVLPPMPAGSGKPDATKE